MNMMAVWFDRLLLTLALLAAGPAAVQAQAPAPLPFTLTMGIYLPVVRDVPRKDVEVSLNFWLLELAKDTKVSFNPVRFYTSVDEMKRDFDSELFNFLVAPAISVARLFRPEDLADGFTGLRQVPDDLLLLVRRDAGIRTPADLPGKRIALLQDDELSDLYLDTLMLKAGKRAGASEFKSVAREDRSAQIVFRLFFGRDDAALLYRNAYETALALNPQIASKVQSLEDFSFKSRVAYTGLFSRRVAPEQRERFVNAALSVDKTARGQQVLAIYHADRVGRIGVADLGPYQQLLEEYRTVKAGVRPAKRVAP